MKKQNLADLFPMNPPAEKVAKVIRLPSDVTDSMDDSNGLKHIAATELNTLLYIDQLLDEHFR